MPPSLEAKHGDTGAGSSPHKVITVRHDPIDDMGKQRLELQRLLRSAQTGERRRSLELALAALDADPDTPGVGFRVHTPEGHDDSGVSSGGVGPSTAVGVPVSSAPRLQRHSSGFENSLHSLADDDGDDDDDEGDEIIFMAPFEPPFGEYSGTSPRSESKGGEEIQGSGEGKGGERKGGGGGSPTNSLPLAVIPSLDLGVAALQVFSAARPQEHVVTVAKGGHVSHSAPVGPQLLGPISGHLAGSAPASSSSPPHGGAGAGAGGGGLLLAGLSPDLLDGPLSGRLKTPTSARPMSARWRGTGPELRPILENVRHNCRRWQPAAAGSR